MQARAALIEARGRATQQATVTAPVASQAVVQAEAAFKAAERDFERTRDLLAELFDGPMEERRPRMAKTLEIREAPLRVLHQQQIALLREWRDHVSEERTTEADALLPKLLLSINAIASGLRTFPRGAIALALIVCALLVAWQGLIRRGRPRVVALVVAFAAARITRIDRRARPDAQPPSKTSIFARGWLPTSWPVACWRAVCASGMPAAACARTRRR